MLWSNWMRCCFALLLNIKTKSSMAEWSEWKYHGTETSQLTSDKRVFCRAQKLGRKTTGKALWKMASGTEQKCQQIGYTLKLWQRGISREFTFCTDPPHPPRNWNIKREHFHLSPRSEMMTEVAGENNLFKPYGSAGIWHQRSSLFRCISVLFYAIFPVTHLEETVPRSSPNLFISSLRQAHNWKQRQRKMFPDW